MLSSAVRRLASLSSIATMPNDTLPGAADE
jgi:hypothetical protein